MAKNFKSNKAYKSWLAYGHASGEFAKTRGNQKVSIKGKLKKVKHEHGGPHDPPYTKLPEVEINSGPTYVSSLNDPRYQKYLQHKALYDELNTNRLTGIAKSNKSSLASIKRSIKNIEDLKENQTLDEDQLNTLKNLRQEAKEIESGNFDGTFRNLSYGQDAGYSFDVRGKSKEYLDRINELGLESNWLARGSDSEYHLPTIAAPTQEYVYDETEAAALNAENAFNKMQALKEQQAKEQKLDVSYPEGSQLIQKDYDPAFGAYSNYMLTPSGKHIPVGKTKEDYEAWKQSQNLKNNGVEERRLTPMTFQYGGPYGNPPKKRIKVGGTSIAIPNINSNLSYAAIPAAWVGGLVQGMANKKNKFEESPKGIIKQNPRKVTASYRYGGPPYETETTEEVNEDAMDGMMKARIAYEVMHGNPAAKRLIAPTDEPIITEVEELDDEGYTRTYTNEGTHFMGRKDNVVIPYIQGSPGNLQLDLSYGKDSKEAMKFDSAEDAKYFANENYKRVSPAFQKTYGGPKYPSGPYYPYKGSTLRVNKSYDKNHVQPSVFPNGGKLVTIGDKTYDTSSKEYRKLVESGKVKPYTTDTESGIGAFDYGNLPDLEITAPETSSYGLHAPIDKTSDWTDGRVADGIDPKVQKRIDDYYYSIPRVVNDMNKQTAGMAEFTGIPSALRIIDHPKQIAKDVVNTVADVGEWMSPVALRHLLPKETKEKLKEKGVDFDKNILGNPYWSGLEGATDAMLFAGPVSKGVTAGAKAGFKGLKAINKAANPYYRQLKNTVLPISDEISPGLFHTKTAQYGPYSKWHKARAHAGDPNAVHTTDIISKQNLEGSVSDALSDRLSSLTGRPKRLDKAGIPYSTDPIEGKNMMYMNKVIPQTGSPYYTVPSAFMDSPIDAGRGFNSLMGKLKRGDVVTMDPSNSLSLDSYKSFLSRGKGNKFDLTTDAENLIPLNQYSKKWQGFNLKKKGEITPEEFYKPSGDAFTLDQADFWGDKVQSMINKSKIKPGGITDVSKLNRYDFSGDIADKNKFDIYMPIPRLTKRKHGGNITNKLLKNSNTINMANSKRKYNRGGLIAPVPQFPHGGEFHAATPLTTEQIKAKEAAYLQFSKANPGVSFEDWANSVSANSSQALSSWDPRTSNQGYQGIMSNDIVPLNLNAPSAGPIGNTNILDTPPNANLKNRGGFETRNVAPTFNMGGYMQYPNGGPTDPPFTKAEFEQGIVQGIPNNAISLSGNNNWRSTNDKYQYYLGEDRIKERSPANKILSGLGFVGLGTGIGYGLGNRRYNQHLPIYQQQYSDYVTDRTNMGGTWADPSNILTFEEYQDFYNPGSGKKDYTKLGAIMGLGTSAMLTPLTNAAFNKINEKRRNKQSRELREAMKAADDYGTGGYMKYANGGDMGQFSNVPVTEFNNGGTHEANPLGGIPQGPSALVEEGELKLDLPSGEQFIVSPKIMYKKNDKEVEAIAQELGISEKEFKRFAGKDMVSVFKSLTRKNSFNAEKREGDTIQENSIEADIMPFVELHTFLTERKNAQEEAKKEQAFAQDMDMMMQEHPEYMQAMMAQQQQQGPSPEEQAMMEQQMMQQQGGAPQGMPPMMGTYGGMLEYKNGGLWANIRAKRARIKAGSGESMRTPGSKGAPTAQALKDSQTYGGKMNPDGSVVHFNNGGYSYSDYLAPQQAMPVQGVAASGYAQGGMMPKQYKYGAGMKVAGNVLSTASPFLSAIPGIGPILKPVAAFAGDALTEAGNQKAAGEETNWQDIATKGAIGAGTSFIPGAGAMVGSMANKVYDETLDSSKKSQAEIQEILNNPDHPEYEKTVKMIEESKKSNKTADITNQVIGTAGQIAGGIASNQANTAASNVEEMDAFAAAGGAPEGTTTGYSGGVFTGANDMSNYSSYAPGFTAGADGMATAVPTGNAYGGYMKYMHGGVMKYEDGGPVLYPSDPEHFMNSYENYKKYAKEVGLDPPSEADFKEERTLHMNQYMSGTQRQAIYDKYPELSVDEDIDLSQDVINKMRMFQGEKELAPNSESYISQTGMNLYDPAYKNYREQLAQASKDKQNKGNKSELGNTTDPNWFNNLTQQETNALMSGAPYIIAKDGKKYNNPNPDPNTWASTIKSDPMMARFANNGFNNYNTNTQNNTAKASANKGNKSDPAIYPNDPTNPYNSFDNYKKFIKKLNPNDPAPTRAEFEEERKNNMDQYMTQAQRDAIYNQYPNIAPSTGANTPNYVTALDPQGSAVPNFTPFFNNQQQPVVAPVNQNAGNITKTPLNIAGAAGDPAEIEEFKEKYEAGSGTLVAVKELAEKYGWEGSDKLKEAIESGKLKEGSYNYQSPDLNLGKSGNAGTTVKESALPYALAGTSALYNTLSPRLRKTLQGKDYISPYQKEAEVDYDLSEERKQFKRDAAGILKSARNVAGGNAGAYLANLGNYQNQLAQRTAQSFAKENMLETQANAAINARNTAGMNRQNQIQNTMDYQQALAKQQAIAAGDTAALEALAIPFAARQQEKAGINLVNAYLGPNSPFSMKYQTIGEQFKNRKNTARYGGHLTKKKK